MLQYLKRIRQTGDYTRPVAAIQRSQYANSKNEYLCITLARPLNRQPHLNQSVTVGFLINSEVKKRLKFFEDTGIPVKNVGESCERCPIRDCEVRAAQPKILDRALNTAQLEIDLGLFINKMKK